MKTTSENKIDAAHAAICKLFLGGNRRLVKSLVRHGMPGEAKIVLEGGIPFESPLECIAVLRYCGHSSAAANAAYLIAQAWEPGVHISRMADVLEARFY